MTAALSGPTTHSHTPNVLVPPAPRSTQRSVYDITLGFFKEKTKEVSKIFGYAAGWAVEARPDLPSNVKDLGHLMTDFKNFFCVTEIPEKTDKVGKAFRRLLSSPSTETARGVLKETTSWINSVADGISLSHKFIPIQKTAMTWIKGISFAATTAGSLNGAIQEGQEIAKIQEPDAKKTFLHMINIARDVSYLALGLIGLYFVVTGTPYVTAMMLGTLTSGLTCTIGGYFYERIVDPYQKHQNKDAIILNLRDQNQYLTQRVATAAVTA